MGLFSFTKRFLKNEKIFLKNLPMIEEILPSSSISTSELLEQMGSAFICLSSSSKIFSTKQDCSAVGILSAL